MLGASFDGPEENRAFAEKYAFPFPLLCDTDREVGLAYHACSSADATHARRLTYLIGPDGRIERAIDTKDPAGQAQDVLAGLGAGA